MRFRIVSDSNVEAGLSEISDGLFEGGFRNYFGEKSYDNSGLALGVVLMCRDPELDFKRRVRFSKQDNTLYVDVMLDLQQMSLADAAKRRRLVAEKLTAEIPKIIAKYKFKDFDLSTFSSDLQKWFEENGWVGSRG